MNKIIPAYVSPSLITERRLLLVPPITANTLALSKHKTKVR